MTTTRHLRLFTVLVSALAAFQAGALTAQQQVSVEVVTGPGGGGRTVVAGGNITLSAPVEQSGSGIVVGRVVDADSQRPVPGAIVTLGGSFSGTIGRGGGALFGAGGGPGAAGSNPVPRVMTDSDGRFAFRNLPGGAFNVTTQKPGYLDGAYGRLRPDGPSRTVELADAERRDDVVVRMFQPAAITGRIVDDRGEPVVGAEVRAYRRQLVSGRRELQPEGPVVTTDDRGVYRLSNLVPGEYVVAAPTVLQSAPANFQMRGELAQDLMATMMTAGNASISLNTGGARVGGNDQFVVQDGRSLYGAAPENDGRLLSFPTVYHPAASVASEAAPITVRSGEERSSVDIALPLVPTTTIGGRLMGPDGPAASFALHLVPTDTGDLSSDPDVATAITDQDGSFLFIGVPAGNYVVQTVRMPRGFPRVGANTTMISAGGGRAMVFATEVQASGRGGAMTATTQPQGEPPPTLWTSVPVAVGGTAVSGLAITLQEGFAVSGRIEFEGAAERPDANQMARIVVIATPVEGAQTRPANGTVQADGVFKTPGMVPGRYLMRAANAGPAWTLKSVTAGGIDVSENPIDLTRNVGNVVVTFTDKATSVAGVVRDSQGTADDEAAVIVFPADNRAWMTYGTNPRRMQMTRVSRTGAFDISALPPGDYNVIAVNEQYAGEWQDPRFLERISYLATRVSVTPGGRHTQDLETRDVSGLVGGVFALLPVAGPGPMPAATLVAAIAWDDPARTHGPFVPDVDAAEPQVRDRSVAPLAGTASVSGRVIEAGGSAQPVRRARVTMRAADSRTEYAVMTDDEGRFVLASLPPGRYSLVATKPAFLPSFYGSKRAGAGPGTPLALTGGRSTDELTLPLTRGAVISGRVTDDNGEPYPGATVRVLPYSAGGSARAGLERAIGGGIIGQGLIRTDDLGRYRVFGLAPGQYSVMASPLGQGGTEIRQLSRSDVDAVVADIERLGAGAPPPSVSASASSGVAGGGANANVPLPVPLGGRAVGFAPVYYPGTTVASEARPVTVAAGQELENIDMPVQLVPVARIEGTIAGPDGRPLPGVTALLLPEGDSPVMLIGMTSIIRTRPDGTFSAANVAPGRYTLAARYDGGRGATRMMDIGGGGVFVAREDMTARPPAGEREPEGPAPKPLWAQATLDVNGQDISGVALTLQEGMAVSGRIVFAGERAAPADLTAVRINLLPIARGGLAIGLAGTTADADGGFQLAGAAPGEYRLAATLPGSGFSADSGWQLQSAISGGRDVLDTNLVVEPGRAVDDLVLTFTDRRTELSGTVTDPAGEPVSDLTILVFPTERAFWSADSRRMPRPQQPGSDGRFSVDGLPPGEYYLAAVTQLEPENWGDPNFMDQLAAASIRITLAEGEKKVQDIRIGG